MKAQAISSLTGASAIELMVVTLVIIVLTLTGLFYYQRLIDRSQAATLQVAAARFTQGIANAHLHWMTDHRPAQLLFGRTTLTMNPQGWPVDAAPLSDREADSVCARLGDALQQAPDNTQPLRAAVWRVEDIALAGCRFHLFPDADTAFYFDYRWATGVVTAGRSGPD